ncbi:efflux RND transporter periplasmic adaptor subunit [Photobacterium sp. SDRW27]|uniref:efflux RND transporter periplasmic adaptor subunit n=1 Tax=Photobacterium obscurum TaxID=2829490 RepID=UPI002243DACF|nr:efflux RND transporter periplasmic adaptor subunit [Photobacterium obscurum]MCW8327302.1 efflux RND transporter periplasmic adaptor subunit [Photobacterium obscurum]
MKKLSFIVLAISSALALQGCEKPQVEERQKVQPVNVGIVSLGDNAPQLTFPAVAAAADKSSLSFRIQGEVTRIHVRPGDFVKKGQLLAQLDPKDYQLEVDDAQAKYNVSDSQYRRSAKLVEKGFLAQSQFDELKAQRRIARARLNIAKLNLTFTQLKAPFDGVISRVPVEQFENVQVGQQVMNIHSTNMVDIQIQAPDLIYSQSSAVDIQESKPGARVLMGDGTEYKAHLKEFTTEPDPNLGSFLVTLTMPMPKDRFILDGMAVEVRADAQKLNIYRQGEAVVPLEAIFNEDGDELAVTDKFVWVVNDDRTVSKRRVSTDKVVPEGVRLLSGLQEGETIVIAGANRLREGQQIEVIGKEAEQE